MHCRRRNMAKVVPGFLVALLSLSHASASNQIPAPRQNRPIALVGGTVHTVSGATIEDATILFDGGKITAIGHNVDLPKGTEEFSVVDKHVYPGMIAANTSLGLVEIGSVRATRDYAETGPINPNVRAEVSVNPDSELLPVARANGLTMAQSVPLSGLISGTSALITLDGWTWEDLTYEAPVGLHVFWPSMTVSTSWWNRQSKEDQLKTRDKNLREIKSAFEDARAYARAKSTENRRSVPHHDSDIRWEAMIPVLEKKVPVFIHANGIHEIQAAIDWVTAEDLDMVLVGGYDAWRVADLLVEKDIPVIIADIHRRPQRRWEDYDAPFTLPLKLHEAGVRFCIATGGGGFGSAHVRNLPYHAAMAVAYGLPKEVALKSLTLYPAQIFGVDDRVGALEVGKEATLIVTDGDPLEITTNVEMEFIEGRQIDLSSRHTQLYEKYRAKFEQLDSPAAKQVSSGD